MIIHWSEYTLGGKGTVRQCALHGESASGHCFHICTGNTEDTVELWAESAETLDYIGDFPSETAARIHAERLAASA